MELYELTAYQAAEAIEKKEVTALDLTESIYKRIAEVEDKIKGFINIRELEEVLSEAAIAQDLLENGHNLSPLCGIPMTLKDNICTLNLPTTCGSRMLQDYHPPYDAHVAEKLKEAGTILIGKSNMDEFAMGSSTENSSFYPTRNPWDLRYVPGGSSGGSAALVAARETFFALGSDTGGSVRQPASLCGVVGFKPTYGLVSRYGLIAFASSLDQIGTFTRDIRDCALVLDIIAGHDSKDSTSVSRKKENYSNNLEGGTSSIRVGMPRECFGEGVEEGVKNAVQESMEKCQQVGAVIEEISFPHNEYALPAYYLVSTAEASSNLARYDGVQYGFRSPKAENLLELYKKSRKEGFGSEVKRRIMLGTYSLSSGYYDAYYLKALKVRSIIRKDFESIFKNYDFVVMPTSPSVAFALGEKVDDPLTMYLNDIFTVPANLAGLPAISIPCGFSKGLPVGLQIVGRPFDEKRLLQFSFKLESLLKVKDIKAEIAGEG